MSKERSTGLAQSAGNGNAPAVAQHTSRSLAPTASTAPMPVIPAINFSDFIMVDWSASSVPKLGKDSIWIHHSAEAEAVNIASRAEAYSLLCEYFREAVRQERRVLCGFDLCLGFPRGAVPQLRRVLGKTVGRGEQGGSPNIDPKPKTEPEPEEPVRPNISLKPEPHNNPDSPTSPNSIPHWQWIWAYLNEQIQDDMHGKPNKNNRFEVANRLNAVWAQGQEERYGPFWGHPASPQHRYAHLQQTASGRNPRILERRITEQKNKSMTVWQLSYPGAVGGQTLMGIPYLYRLRFTESFSPFVRVWPFDSDWAWAGNEHTLANNRSADLRSCSPSNPAITLVETYYSLLPLTSGSTPKDKAQVESATAHCISLQRANKLQHYFYSFSEAYGGGTMHDSATMRNMQGDILNEEGWTLFQEP